VADTGYDTTGSLVLVIGRREPRPNAALAVRQTAEERRLASEACARNLRQVYRVVVDTLAQVQGAASYGLTMVPAFASGGFVLPPVFSHDAFVTGSPVSMRVSGTGVSDGYFDAMGVRLLQGRTFDGRDAVNGRKVALIDASVAARLWPKGDALGKSLAFAPKSNAEPDWLEVIGIVDDVKPVRQDVAGTPRVYVSLLQQWGASVFFLIVRGPTHDPAFVAEVKNAVARADVFSDVLGVMTIEQVIADALYPQRIAAGVLAAAGLIGLSLACVGLYGVIAFSVSQRLREIGIRAALGADRDQIVRLFVRDGLRATALAGVLGFILGLVALKLTAGMVPGLPRSDPAALVVVPAALALTVLAACWLPARRAARVDPVEVLRGL
jgi:putative ABC transport system permease protein